VSASWERCRREYGREWIATAGAAQLEKKEQVLLQYAHCMCQLLLSAIHFAKLCVGNRMVRDRRVVQPLGSAFLPSNCQYNFLGSAHAHGAACSGMVKTTNKVRQYGGGGGGRDTGEDGEEEPDDKEDEKESEEGEVESKAVKVESKEEGKGGRGVEDEGEKEGVREPATTTPSLCRQGFTNSP